LCKKKEKSHVASPLVELSSGQKTTNIRRNATMAQYHITVNDELLHGLLTRDEGLSKLLKQVLNRSVPVTPRNLSKIDRVTESTCLSFFFVSSTFF
jgi:hypothetical protein